MKESKNLNAQNKYLIDLLERLNGELSKKDILIIIEKANFDKLNIKQKKLLLNIRNILQSKSDKSQFVINVFNSYCSVKNSFKRASVLDDFDYDTLILQFDIDMKIPKIICRQINLLAKTVIFKNENNTKELDNQL